MQLREVRKRNRLTLEGLAFLSEVDIGTISRIERGLVNPRPDTVVKLARALGMSVTTMRAYVNASQSDTGPEAA